MAVYSHRQSCRQTDWLTPRKLTEVICFATGFNKWQEIVWDAVPSSNIKMEEKINREPELSGWTISGTGELKSSTSCYQANQRSRKPDCARSPENTLRHPLSTLIVEAQILKLKLMPWFLLNVSIYRCSSAEAKYYKSPAFYYWSQNSPGSWAVSCFSDRWPLICNNRSDLRGKCPERLQSEL